MDHIYHSVVELDFTTRQFPVVSVGPLTITFQVEKQEPTPFDTIVTHVKTESCYDDIKRCDHALVLTLMTKNSKNDTDWVKLCINANKPGNTMRVNLRDAVKCILDVVCVGKVSITETPTTTTELTTLSDLDIVCDDGRRIKAFRVLLARSSPVFAAMFTNGSFKQSNELVIRDAKSESIEKMVNMVMGSESPNVDVDDFDFVLLCDRYEMRAVVNKWVSLAFYSIDDKNVISIMRVAQLLNNTCILRKTMRHIKKNPSVLHLADLTKEEMVQILMTK